jgi:hypothetical protein
MTTFNQNRTYGVEIEIEHPTNGSRGANALATAIEIEFATNRIDATCTFEGYNHRDNANNHWKIVTDASLRNGLEVVSPILKGFEGKAQIEAVLTAIRSQGYEVNFRTGLHVHHDARNLTGYQIGAIIGTYTAFQDVIDYSVAPSRRDSSRSNGNVSNYCNNMSAHMSKFNRNNSTLKSLKNVTANQAKLNGLTREFGSGRYVNVNFTSISAHGTLEFRQHQGTLNFSKMWAWIMVTQCIVESVAQKSVVSFPQPTATLVEQGKSFPKGSYFRFKRIMQVIPRYNDNDVDASNEYCQAFRVFYKNLKKFANDANVDVKTLGSY